MCTSYRPSIGNRLVYCRYSAIHLNYLSSTNVSGNNHSYLCHMYWIDIMLPHTQFYLAEPSSTFSREWISHRELYLREPKSYEVFACLYKNIRLLYSEYITTFLPPQQLRIKVVRPGLRFSHSLLSGSGISVSYTHLDVYKRQL